MKLRSVAVWMLLLAVLLGCTAPSGTQKTAAVATPSASSYAEPIEVILTAPGPQETTPEATSIPTASPVPTPTPEPTPTPAPFVLAPVPAHLRGANGFVQTQKAGVLYSESLAQYVAYGTTGGEPAFYPSDEAGRVEPLATPYERVCTVPVYAPEDVPGADGDRMLAVYLPSQSVVAFVAKDGVWPQERVMICSTGRANHDTPTGKFKIYQTHAYQLLGTEDSPCYGLWACRFRQHHLFHSVPISAEAGRDSENGHRWMSAAKYEKLGSVASDGCIRMTVVDAKWIYDACQNQTISVWVTKTAGPTPTKPPALIYEEPYMNKKGYGWDPTDPHPENPYHALSQPK